MPKLLAPMFGDVWSWEGEMTPQTIIKLPDGREISFQSLVTYTNGDALVWYENEKDKIIKHLSGKHDQSSHAGGKGSGSGKAFDTSNYKRLQTPDGKAYDEAVAKLTRPDGTPVSQEVIDASRSRYGFRSSAIPEGLADKEFSDLDKEANDFVKKNPVSVMVPEDAIYAILDEGRLKTIYDMPDAKDEDYIDYRTIYEHVSFGYGSDLPIDQRPVSGAVLPKAQNNDAFDRFGDNYGSVQIVLKDSVKDRTTYTLGDSLDRFQKPFSIGENVPRTADLWGTARSASGIRSKGNTNMFEEPRWHETDYVEAQVHGGVRLGDIAKVVFHYPDYDPPTDQLKSLGIDFEINNGDD
jgi:hypothetical protein